MASAAAQAAKEFIGLPGHKTTVSESHNPAVTSEIQRPHEHQNITTAVQKEVHQDHHHTTVQPLHHRETLPEQHTHNIIPVEHKTVEHDVGHENKIKEALQREHAQFKNTTTTHDTTHSEQVLPSVSAERVHHHVHEHVQPVIQKEVIQPKVVHTTIPIHETHQAKSQHHGISHLPAKSLNEWVKGGGSVDGLKEAGQGGYDGCPRPYDRKMQDVVDDGDRELDHHHGEVRRSMDAMNLNGKDSTSRNGTTHGTAGTAAAAAAPAAVAAGEHHHHNHNNNNTVNNTANKSDFGDSHFTSSNHNNHTHSPSTASSDIDASAGAEGIKQKKPSLLSRLNPRKDADGDGKRGFMD